MKTNIARQVAYGELVKMQEAAELAFKLAVHQMEKYPTMPNGLFTDAARAMPGYVEDRANREKKWAELQKINAYISKNFAKEHRDARDARRAAKLIANQN